MSKQDIGFFDSGGFNIDLKIEDGDLKADNGFETAVLISLFTDKFIEIEDLQEDEDNPRGWWADQISEPVDDQIGSKIWATDRVKIEDATEATLEEFAKDGLKWMLDDGIAESITAVATRIDIKIIELQIEITRPSGENVPFQFIWDGQDLKRQEAS